MSPVLVVVVSVVDGSVVVVMPDVVEPAELADAPDSDPAEVPESEPVVGISAADELCPPVAASPPP